MSRPATDPPTLPAALAIRQAGEPDAGAVASLGARLFAQAYGPTHPDPELGDYLARAFRAADLAADLRTARVTVLLVDEIGVGPVGYAQLRPGARLDVSGWTGRSGCEIQRFYVDRAWQGRGVGDALMAACTRSAGQAGAELLWLQVWQEADWAIRFYQRAGFTIVTDTPFTWGSRVETDWLMARTLPAEGGT